MFDDTVLAGKPNIVEDVKENLSYTAPFDDHFAKGEPLDYHVAYLPFSEKKITYQQVMSYFRFLVTAQVLLGRKKEVHFYVNQTMYEFIALFTKMLQACFA
jgi:hypothetical protein